MTRRTRGRETEHIVAEYMAAHGWRYALATGSGTPGPDVTGMPGLDCEVKARRGLNLTAALDQLEARNRGSLPFAVIRPDGFGPARIGAWPAVMRLDRFVPLLHAAEWGDV